MSRGRQTVRLLHVDVQPAFALDDGENLQAIEHPSVRIPASEWATYSSERFAAEVAAWQERLDKEAEAADDDPER